MMRTRIAQPLPVAQIVSGACGLTDVAGVAGAAWFPLGAQHAWCADPAGQVVEPI